MKKIIVSMFTLLLALNASASVPELVKDLNPFSQIPYFVSNRVVINDKIIFTANSNQEQGDELHTVNTTTGEYSLLKDIVPGPGNPSISSLVKVGNKAYFSANINGNSELWESDGTLAGTKKVIFTNPGLLEANYSTSVLHVTAIDGAGHQKVAFNATSQAAGLGSFGTELHIYDTTTGLVQLIDVNTISNSGPRNILFINEVGNPRLVFAASSAGSTTGQEPHQLLLNTMTASLLVDVAPGSLGSSPREFVYLSGTTPPRLLFSAHTAANGRELYSSTGPGNFTLIELNNTPSASSSSDPQQMTKLSEQLVVFSAFGGSIVGNELYSSDGTVVGTKLIEIWPGNGGSNPRELTFFNNKVFFRAAANSEGSKIYYTDGNTANILKDINPSKDAGPSFLGVADNTLFFGAENTAFGRELWKTDGTEGGTVLVQDLVPGPSSSFYSIIAAAQNKYFFIATVGDSGTVYAANNSGVQALANTPKREPLGSSGWGYQPLGNNGDVFFGAEDRHLGYEIAKISGHNAMFIGDVIPGEAGVHYDRGITLPSGLAIFEGQELATGVEPWVTDGTVAGTKILKDICPGDCYGRPRRPIIFQGQAYFIADNSFNYELWRSNGTPAGTVKVTDYDAMSGRVSDDTDMLVFNNKLYFTADDGTTGLELHVFDGSSYGLFKDINTAGSSSFPKHLTKFGDYFFFAADDNVETTLWRSNGTSAGTVKIPGPLNPQELVVSGNKLYFKASAVATGSELYVLASPTGTPALVKDIRPGSDNSNPEYLAAISDNRVTFAAKTDDFGTELWVSNGTNAGTFRLTDLAPGVDDSDFQLLGTGDGKAIYRAKSATLGYELLITDGTVAGTKLHDLYTGSESSDPYDGLYHFGTFYFFADDGVHGYEPWKIVFDQCPLDANKKVPGVCGCGVPDLDLNNNGILDCLGDEEQEFSKAVLKQYATDLEQLVKKIKFIDARASKKKIRRSKVARKQARESLSELLAYAKGAGASVQINSTNQSIQAYLSSEAIEKKVKQAFKFKNLKFSKRKRVARKALKKLIDSL